jgi:hypothetical protein
MILFPLLLPGTIGTRAGRKHASRGLCNWITVHSQNGVHGLVMGSLYNDNPQEKISISTHKTVVFLHAALWNIFYSHSELLFLYTLKIKESQTENDFPVPGDETGVHSSLFIRTYFPHPKVRDLPALIW